MRKVLLGTAAIALAVPALTIAGPKTTSGDQSLQITAKFKPNKAKAGVALDLNVDYESLNQGAQVKENTKSVGLRLPHGTKVHTDRYPACLVSAAVANPDTACTDDQKVGAGTATADARPTLPSALDATVTLYNAMDDTNPDGSKRDTAVPAVLLVAKVPSLNNYTTVLPFDIHGSTLRLDYAPPRPGQSQLFHIQKVQLAIDARGKTSYLTAPAACPKKGRKWTFKMTIANFDGPSVSAKDTRGCRK